MALTKNLLHAPSKWLAWAVHLAALALLAYSMAQWVVRGRALLLEEQSVPSAIEAASPALARGHDPVATLRELRPFGAVDERSLELSEALPVSGLDIVLSGVMLRPEGRSLAVLSVAGQPPLPYAIGQELLPGAIVHDIRPDHLVVRRPGGLLEIVPLKDRDKPSSPAAAASAPRPPAP